MSQKSCNKEKSWLDLPEDHYTALLGYDTSKSRELDVLVKSYHRLPKAETKILSERISIIKDNHLKHIEDKINSINKVMYTIGVMVLGQLLWVITRALM